MEDHWCRLPFSQIFHHFRIFRPLHVQNDKLTTSKSQHEPGQIQTRQCVSHWLYTVFSWSKEFLAYSNQAMRLSLIIYSFFLKQRFFSLFLTLCLRNRSGKFMRSPGRVFWPTLQQKGCVYCIIFVKQRLHNVGLLAANLLLLLLLAGPAAGQIGQWANQSACIHDGSGNNINNNNVYSLNKLDGMIIHSINI